MRCHHFEHQATVVTKARVLARPNAHLDEIAELLATALARARLTKSTPLFDDRGEKFVDLSGGESGHATVSKEETAR